MHVRRTGQLLRYLKDNIQILNTIFVILSSDISDFLGIFLLVLEISNNWRIPIIGILTSNKYYWKWELRSTYLYQHTYKKEMCSILSLKQWFIIVSTIHVESQKPLNKILYYYLNQRKSDFEELLLTLMLHLVVKSPALQETILLHCTTRAWVSIWSGHIQYALIIVSSFSSRMLIHLFKQMKKRMMLNAFCFLSAHHPLWSSASTKKHFYFTISDALLFQPHCFSCMFL